MLESLVWTGNSLHVLDQTQLPHTTHYINCSKAEQVAAAIREMRVRGAPAISIAAAYGVVLGLREGIEDPYSMMLGTRPTAVNLKWAMDAQRYAEDKLQYALDLHAGDVAVCKDIGGHGRRELQHVRRHDKPARIMTICNTGSLATGGYGTALGVVRALHTHGRLETVYVPETRPYLQGSRLTAYECEQEDIPYTLITDSMVSAVMMVRGVDAVVVGCDRVARNGDTANKIGTLQMAVAADYFGVPFYVAMPTSSYDYDTPSGFPNAATGHPGIVIEERPPAELLKGANASEGTPVWNPAFDVTSHHLITGYITEFGVYYTDEIESAMAKLLGRT
jgi:methylthioribose-1-phosphate isomerase